MLDFLLIKLTYKNVSSTKSTLSDSDLGLLAAVGEVVISRADVVVLSRPQPQQRPLVGRRRVVEQVVHVALVVRRVRAVRLTEAAEKEGRNGTI